MMLLPRFYNLIEDAQSNLINLDREAKYISYNETEMQDMNVLTCKETKSTFIKIKNVNSLSFYTDRQGINAMSVQISPYSEGLLRFLSYSFTISSIVNPSRCISSKSF